MKVSEAEHQAFLQDCREMTIYYNYLKHQFNSAVSFNGDELLRYHKAYVILRSSWKDYNGSPLAKQIQDIVTANKTPEERYNNYKSCINNEIVIYNRAYSSRPNKQIRI